MVAASAGEALGAATDAIAAAGVETARLDAELLLAEATGWDRARLAAEPEAELPPAAARSFAEMVRRRLRREPVAYILGRKGFRRIELAVDRRVLIPRPETELLVELALALDPRRVLDVGTGSGAIALAIADELPRAQVDATDPSAAAIQVARANIERLGLYDRVRCGEGILPRGDGADAPALYDLVVANLPYVSEAEWGNLAPEIRDHEPREALVPGPTGLEAIQELLGGLEQLPERPGAIALEVGEGQAGEVIELVRGAGFGAVEARRDLAGIERVVVGR
ncbi:MAG: peptide chain release factor N(5)-glutamine methyltransferase [Solirubrobacterales bacterium]